MNKKKQLPLPTKKNAEKAINQLEKNGHSSLRSFINFINSPHSLKDPLGPTDNCLSLETAHRYLKNIASYIREKTPPSIIGHLDSCEFCSKLIEKIPEPKITPRLWDKIRERTIQGVEDIVKKTMRLEANVVHKRNINQHVRSICIELPDKFRISDIIKDSLLIDKHSEPLVKTSIVDCDKDEKNELQVVIDKELLENIGIPHERHKITGSLKNGKSFFAIDKP